MTCISRLVGTTLVLTTALSVQADSKVRSNSTAGYEADAKAPLSLDADDCSNNRTDNGYRMADSDGSSIYEYELIEDEVTTRQSVDSYTSLEDGQPLNPASMELLLDMGWQTKSGEHDPIFLTTELQYTGYGNRFLRNMQLQLSVPMEYGLGGVDGNADLTLGWQQRWVAENGNMPTLATLAEVRLPTGYQSSGIDGTITGIVAKDLGPGTAYLNAFAKTANGNNIDDLRHFQYGFRAGYKWRVNDKFALIADYVHKSSEMDDNDQVNLLEISSTWVATDNLTIGPGIIIGLDDHEETPDFGAGIRMMISF